jgi:hypothetical protein
MSLLLDWALSFVCRTRTDCYSLARRRLYPACPSASPNGRSPLPISFREYRAQPRFSSPSCHAPFPPFKRGLRFGNRVAAPFLLLPPDDLFLSALVFAPLLLLLDAMMAGRAALSVLGRTRSFGLAEIFFGLCRGSASAKCVGRSGRSLKVASEPTGRPRTTPGFDIVATMISGSLLSLATP